MSIPLSIHMLVCLSTICPSVRRLVCTSDRPSVCPSPCIHLSVHSFVRLSVRLSVCLTLAFQLSSLSLALSHSTSFKQVPGFTPRCRRAVSLVLVVTACLHECPYSNQDNYLRYVLPSVPLPRYRCFCLSEWPCAQKHIRVRTHDHKLALYTHVIICTRDCVCACENMHVRWYVHVRTCLRVLVRAGVCERARVCVHVCGRSCPFPLLSISP